MKKSLLTLFIVAFSSIFSWASANKAVKLISPDGKLSVTITIGKSLSYTVVKDGKDIVSGEAKMMLAGGKIIGEVNGGIKITKRTINENLPATRFYKRSNVTDYCNEITITLKNGSVIWRAYNEGIAYRFAVSQKDSLTVDDEQADFNFPSDYKAYMIHCNNAASKENWPLMNSFEGLYDTAPISQQNHKKIFTAPMLADIGGGKKLLIAEADVEDYPGLFLLLHGSSGVSSYFARFPKTENQGGHNNLQMIVSERENFIAKVAGKRTFPWRVMIVADNDGELMNNDVIYCLDRKSPLSDTSWIKPGKVAWDWWNNWNLKGVNFRTGVNNDTYKYYIDFASHNGIEYVILDEGWAVNEKADLMQVVPEIDLQEIIDYAKSRNVGIILWAGYWAYARDMEAVTRHFSEMGVKGFKIDFMNRNDQKMENFTWKAAEVCAKYHMLVDFHGIFAPNGLTRTYPNVLNFEGVAGLEQMKWQPKGYDQVTYDVELPFIRMAAGPMDYTQGAMCNATKDEYYPCYSNPMSQGTRCHQLAEYVVFLSPLNMLCDAPTNYEAEQLCTDFIAKVPVTWDETKILYGKVGEYVAVARRSGDTWYIGGINNWDARDVDVDLSFIGLGEHSIDMFTDGINADRNAEDFQHSTTTVGSGKILKIHLAPGGGFAAKIK
jgi:alpha-glucosidase